MEGPFWLRQWPCRVVPGAGRLRSGPCPILAGSSLGSVGLYPAYSDSAPAPRALSLRPRRPYPARRAAATLTLDTARTLPAFINIHDVILVS